LRPDSADGHAKLAFAQLLTDESPKALASAQRALELGDQSAEAHYVIAETSLRAGDAKKAVDEAETALQINPNFAVALITKSLANRDLKLYAESASSLEQYLALNPNDLDAESWREQLTELRRPIDLESNSGPRIFAAKEVTQKVRVLKKIEPQYTETARIVGIKGNLVLRAVFSAEGEVKHIEIVRALGFGLNTRAIEAARQIRFTPAMVDGRPVSMFIQLEYNFNLY
jgi:TonB family protein